MRLICAMLPFTLLAGVACAADYPSIPEPMIFDMVRPLGAERGELEVNVLAQTGSPFGAGETEWAPEIEYAFAKGHAIEFELPFDGRRLAAYKLGLQSLLGVSTDGRTAHGVQYLGIYHRDTGRYSNTLLYLAGLRFNARWSTMNMIGLDDISLGSGAGRNGLLLNHALFYDARADTILGAELNVAGGAERSVKLSPQIHRRVSHAANVQFSLGVEKLRAHRARPTAGLRVIREF
ncbi:hypothetical protein [Sphingomonas sp.]|jgi:hypothetical protein|uniref:hypothetical protein n=1 Tax=Sphingomonas sp. TaxID=28214 RepID=UPI00261209D5|nr:hypothetical protein [Sphingomonas sp.]MDF2493316.1 hypothetical protein [Sphingomonas sp.]